MRQQFADTAGRHQPAIADNGAIIADMGNHGGLEAVFDRHGFPTYDGSGADALAELRGLLRKFPFAKRVRSTRGNLDSSRSPGLRR